MKAIDEKDKAKFAELTSKPAEAQARAFLFGFVTEFSGKNQN